MKKTTETIKVSLGKERENMMMKKSKKMVAALVLMMLALLINIIPVQAAIPGISTSRYIKGYTRYASSNVKVYTSSSCSRQGTSSPYKAYNALVYPGDEIYIYSMNDTSAYISYPTSAGRRKGYVKTITVTENNWSQGAATSRAKINVSKKAGGAYYGYIASGDGVYAQARSGNYTQVVYPVGNLYKIGWISNAAYDSYIGAQSTTPAPTVDNSKAYAAYTGPDYYNMGLSASRIAALDKAKKMVTIRWTSPTTFPTWLSKSGSYNTVKDVYGRSSNSFIQGRTYTGIPYSMKDHSYDDERWYSLLCSGGVTAGNMSGYYYNYSRKTTAKGMDCSYLVYAAYRAAGCSIPYQSTSQMMSGGYYQKISRSNMKPGDVFIRSGHTMMYVGRSGSSYAVFEADADDAKCSYNTYGSSYINKFNCYRLRQLKD